MADERTPSTGPGGAPPDQAELAKEVLAGKREITASVPTGGNMPDMPDDAKKQALEAAQNIKLAGDTKTLPDAESVTPATVGASPAGYGKSLNRIAPEPTPVEPDKG